MKHVVFENNPSKYSLLSARVARVWNGHVWAPIQTLLVKAWLESGEAYLWPNRAAAVAAKFSPPDAGHKVADRPLAGGWVAVADRLPDRPGWYLVYGEGVAMGFRGWGSGRWEDWEVCGDPCMGLDEITHWRHKPARPE